MPATTARIVAKAAVAVHLDKAVEHRCRCRSAPVGRPLARAACTHIVCLHASRLLSMQAQKRGEVLLLTPAGRRSCPQSPFPAEIPRAGSRGASFWRMVCSMTRGPAKPMSAFGSAMMMSPSIAKLAVHAAGGGVGEHGDDRGCPRREWRLTAPVVLAICISERMPSCMRAPPEAHEADHGQALVPAACSKRSGDLFAHGSAHGGHHETTAP